MKRLILLMLTLPVVCLFASGQTGVKNQLTENLADPVGLAVTTPRFTWQLVSEKRNVTQAAYEIKVMSGKTVVWNSGKIVTPQSVHVTYAGIPLQSGRKYT